MRARARAARRAGAARGRQRVIRFARAPRPASPRRYTTAGHVILAAALTGHAAEAHVMEDRCERAARAGPRARAPR